MSPTTLDVASDEEMEVDEGQIPTEQLGNPGDNEAADDAGELIDVPLRKSLKNTTTAAVVVGRFADRGDQETWRSGWKWRRQTARLDQGGSALVSDSLPPSESRRQAVYAALSEMASSAADKCKPLAEDILKFRDTEWFVTESERSAVPPGATSTTTPAGIALHDPDVIKAADLAATAVRGALDAVVEKVDPVAEFKSRMSETALLLAEAALTRRDCETALKNAKAHEKELLDTLQTIQRRGPENFPLWEGSGSAKDTASPPTAATVPSDNAWESHSIDELGLAKGIHQKLIDAGCDTIGRLERRRAEIATGKEKWPKGIGEAAITKIENAVIGWLTENRPADQVATREAAAAAESRLATTSPDSHEDETGNVEARLATLLAEGTEPDWKNGAAQSGAEAYDKDGKLTDCPYTPGIDQDQWLLGFSAAEKADDE